MPMRKHTRKSGAILAKIKHPPLLYVASTTDKLAKQLEPLISPLLGIRRSTL